MHTTPTPPVATQFSVLCVDTSADAAASHAGPALLRDWHAAAVSVARALGGTSGPFDGSHALDAVFGAGADHAERALQCALTLLAQAQKPNATTAVTQLRLGLHSGPADATALDAMQQAAACIARATPVGALGLSVHSQAWLRGVCDVSATTPLRLPGVAVALQCSVLVRARLRPAAAETEPGQSVHAPIGSAAPAAALKQALDAMYAKPQAVAITVVAEAGVGKSHLLRQFLALAERHPHPLHLLRGQALAASEHEAFGLLGDMLRRLLTIDTNDTPAAARGKLEQGIAPWFEPEHGAAVARGHAHVLGHLIGVDASASGPVQGIADDPAQLRRRALHVATQWLRLLSAGGRVPLLLVIEDLHWADSATLEFLEQLLKDNADMALLIVASARPAMAARRPAWMASTGVHGHLKLGRLGEHDSRDLAARLLSKLPQAPAELITLIVNGAQGHPLSIAQRVQLLIDQGVIHATLERWRLDTARLRRAQLPASLDAVVQARLALLPARERAALQQASVLGMSFPAQALALLDADAAQGMPHQRKAAGSMLMAPTASGEQTLSFQHPLLQELTYATVSLLTRRNLHGRFARWLVGLATLHGASVLGQTAHHFERAGEVLLAVEHHVRAAEFAASRYAHSEVLHHVQRGLALLDGPLAQGSAQPTEQELRWRLLLRRDNALRLTGQHTQQLIAIDALAALAEALDDDGKRALAYERRTTYLLWRADYVGLKAAARQAMACAERAGDQRTRIGAMRQLAMAHRYLGDWDAAERLASQGLAQARELGLPTIEGSHLNLLAMVAHHRQDPLARLRWHEQELACARAANHALNDLSATANLGGAWLELGELFAARRFTQEGLRMTRAYGERNYECGTLLYLSKLERWVGQAAAALSLAREAVALAQQVALKRWVPDAWCHVGEAALDLGDYAAAAEAFNTAMALSLADKAASALDAGAGLARLALMQGDVAGAMVHVQTALDGEASTGARQEALDPRHIALMCTLVLSSAGDARANEWLELVHRELMASAASISDEALRQGYLAHIPDHRAILSAWALAQADAASLTR